MTVQSSPQSSDDLSAEVQHVAHVSERNRVQAIRAVQHVTNQFSSDEE